MMEESRADATLEAEIYHPDFSGGAGVWAMAAKSRVARLYHSVALLVPDGRVITAGSNPARKTEELRIGSVLAALLVRWSQTHLQPIDN